MAKMDRNTVVASIEKIASYLELSGENPFRVRAFKAAAKTLLSFDTDLEPSIANGSLAETKGIGPAILEVITELVNTGRSELLEQLREDVPSGLVEMLSISGLGVAKIRQIHKTLEIETLPELEEAARDGRLANLPRFGARTAENVLKGIQFLRKSSQWRLSHHSLEEANTIVAALEQVPHVLSAHVAGAVRRRCEVVRDQIVVVVADVSPADVFASIGALAGVSEIAGEDERRATLRFSTGSPVNVVITPPQNLGAVLAQATGSSGHLAKLTEHATEKGYNLAGTALWKGSRFVPTPSEEALYSELGLTWIPPELREDNNELTPPNDPLIERKDLRGLLHCHTTWSDGTSSVAQMATACKAAGYKYVGITDHSRAAAYAGGLSVDDLKQQWEEIDTYNSTQSGITVLKGIESDILQDGSLDYPDEVLQGFDFVIASVHSRFNLSEEEMTNRFLRAIESPFLTIVGHPTGRLLLSREAYPLDLDRIFEAAGAAGAAIEINADPHRLDLDWRVLRKARDAGVMISIGSDAHTTAGLNNVEFGVGIARKGGLSPNEVLNTRSADEFLAFAKARHN